MVLIGCFASLHLAGCAGKKPEEKQKEKPALVLLEPKEYPDFADDLFFDGLDAAISESLAFLNRVNPSRKFGFGPDLYSVDEMRKSVEVFRNFVREKPGGKEIRRFVAKNYRVYKSTGGPETGRVLFTGYYEPALRGSLFFSDEYGYPVYGPPDDLAVVDLSAFSSKFDGEKITGRWNGKTFIPYHERREIDFGKVLSGRAEPIVYVDDLIDLFFLQVQGSGKAFLDIGGYLNLHYYATNGRPYRSIGKHLIDLGKVDSSEMSMQRIRQYLKEHPEEIESILSYNPSYVFFEVTEKGPLGALGVLLVPGRAVATDRKIFPDAALTFIRTQKPELGKDDEIVRWVDFSRFVLNQDTGGAIRGPGRADIFWGNGPYAEVAAGYSRQEGDMYFLVLKPGAAPNANAQEKATLP